MRVRFGLRRFSGQSLRRARREGDSNGQCKRAFATLMHLTPLVFFFVLAIWPFGADKPQLSIGFQKSLTLNQDRQIETRQPRRAARAADVNGRQPFDKPRDVTPSPFRPISCARQSVALARSPAPPGSEHHARRIIFPQTRYFNELRGTGSACPLTPNPAESSNLVAA